MAADPITAVLNIGNTLINKFVDDPQEQARIQLEMAKLASEGKLEELQAVVNQFTGQLKVNAIEAQHDSIFVAGWRPFIGWVGGAAMAYQFLVYPFLMWIWAFCAAKAWIPADAMPPPVLETGALFSVITGMLGVGMMRSYDKTKGTNTKKVTK